MTAESVANIPAFAAASAQFAKAGAAFKAVPLSLWRTVVMVLILVWLCHSLARLFWLAVPLPKEETPPLVAAQKQVSNSQRSINLGQLQSVKLFGEFNPAPPPVETKPEPPKDVVAKTITKLNLKLQGVIAASTQEKSWAIIGESNDQKLYKVGDKLPRLNNVRLDKVEERRVIIDNNGNKEILPLYGEDEDFTASRNTYTPPPPRAQAQAQPKVEKNTIPASEVRKAKSIGDVVRFMVATEGGKMIGYKVRPGRKRELFDQAGLKNDDIVVSVNGIEVNEPQKVREVYQALKTATEANLEILRDGTTHSIQISMSGD